jgi:hypothetical protein
MRFAGLRLGRKKYLLRPQHRASDTKHSMETISMNYKSCFGDSHRVVPQYRRFWTALVAGILVLFCPAAPLAQGASPCDLTGNGTVDSADVTLAVSMALGQSACFGNISGTGACNVVAVQRVVNAALSGKCIAGKSHTVSISWIASISANVTGYNVYRATTSGGPYVKLTSSPVRGTSYADSGVQAGQTYYYTATSIDDFGNESVGSTETSVTVPFP